MARKNKYKYFAGIDPGQTGAIAVITADGDPVYIEDCPIIKSKNDKRVLNIICLTGIMKRLKRNYKSLFIVIEEPIAMPNNGRSMGSASMLNFGRNAGIWEGIVSSLGIDYTTVRPSEWKKALFPTSGSDKSISLRLAKKMFPKAKKYLILKKHHNRAEALLLAEYARSIKGV